jgi:hypothetical protein
MLATQQDSPPGRTSARVELIPTSFPNNQESPDRSSTTAPPLNSRVLILISGTKSEYGRLPHATRGLWRRKGGCRSRGCGCSTEGCPSRTHYLCEGLEVTLPHFPLVCDAEGMSLTHWRVGVGA